jgi:hypothetical protein
MFGTHTKRRTIHHHASGAAHILNVTDRRGNHLQASSSAADLQWRDTAACRDAAFAIRKPKAD